MAIKKYSNRAAYEGGTRPENESNVSLIADVSEVVIDGLNVRTDAPKEGDIVVIADGGYFFVERETFDKTKLPEGFVYPAVVKAIEGDTVMVIERANTTKALLRAFCWKLTGYTMDGAEHSGTLQLRESSDSYAANHDHVITYTASDIDEMVDALNEAFVDDEVLTAQQWVARREGDDIMLYHKYSDYRQISSNTATGGFTLTRGLAWWIANSNMRRFSGQRSGEGAISNWDRALAYFRQDLSSTTYNPSTDVTSTKRGYPICLPGYLGTSQHQSDHCALLRSHFGDGEDGWLKFMASCKVVPRQLYGAFGERSVSAKEITYRLANTKVALMGETTETSISPLAEYIAAKGYDCDGMRQGDWEAPDIEELRHITEGLHYGTDASRDADYLNAGLNAIGGSAISNGSYLWSVSRYSAYSAWCSYGTHGFFSNYLFSGTYAALGVAHLPLRKP